MGRDRAPGPEAGALRLFVAADVPSDVRAGLAAQVTALHTRIDGARWTPPENWHVTLAFLGRTWPRLLDWVGDRLAVAAATVPAFSTCVKDIGAFPSRTRARVVWAGLADEDGAFARAAGVVQQALSKEFRPENRQFSAHLTLARLDPPSRVERTVIEGAVSSRTFIVEELVLYRSHLRRPAPIYEALARFPLGGGSEERSR